MCDVEKGDGVDTYLDKSLRNFDKVNGLLMDID